MRIVWPWLSPAINVESGEELVHFSFRVLEQTTIPTTARRESHSCVVQDSYLPGCPVTTGQNRVSQKSLRTYITVSRSNPPTEALQTRRLQASEGHF